MRDCDTRVYIILNLNLNSGRSHCAHKLTNGNALTNLAQVENGKKKNMLPIRATGLTVLRVWRPELSIWMRKMEQIQEKSSKLDENVRTR